MKRALAGWAFLGLTGCNALLGIEEVSPRETPAQGGSAGASGEAGKGGNAGNIGGDAGTGGDAGAGAGGNNAGSGGDSGAAGGEGGAAGAGGSEGCRVTGGNGRLRLGNLSPSRRSIDFCLKPEGQEGFEGVKPLLSSEPGCPGGLAYQEITIALPAPAGAHGAKVIDAQDPAGCSGKALADLPLINLPVGKNRSLFFLGREGGQEGPSLRFLPESTPGPLGVALRFLHAASGLGPLDWGLTTGKTLPTEFIAGVVFATGIPFGATPSPSESPFGKIDDAGYVLMQIGTGVQQHGIARTESPGIIAVRDVDLPVNSKLSLLVTGTTEDPGFPVELLVCNEADKEGPLAPCWDLQFPLTVDTFNARLAGVFDNFEGPRRQAILDALPEQSSDILCVGEIWSDQDKKDLIAKAAPSFPFSYWIETDLTTLPDNPTTIDGETPQQPVTPPCSSPEIIQKFNALIDCIRDNCAVDLGNEESHTANGAGVPSKCAAAGVALRSAKPEDEALRCYSCMFSQFIGYEKFSDIRKLCTQTPEATKAFRGSSGALLLSRYPLKDPQAFVLPSTEWQNVVLGATVPIDPPREIDVYCSILTNPPNTQVTRPYAGFYGKGLDPNPWVNEQTLQAKRFLSFLETRSTSRGRASLVLGSLYSGPGHTKEQTIVLQESNPSTIGLLLQRLALSLPGDYGYGCTACPENPLFGGGTAFWQEHILLSGIPVTQVQATEVILTEPVVATGAEGDKAFVPLSSRYGLRSRVLLRY